MKDHSNLIAQLDDAYEGRAVRLPEHLAGWWTMRFKSRFVVDAASDMWWESLTAEARTMSYEGRDGLELISRVLGSWGPCVLLVTDEEPTPIAAYLGLGVDLIAGIRETRNFEFVILDAEVSRFVVDTHMESFLTNAAS